ncbi:MAG: DAK2 domain-containing protein [Erysipelotrichaceae bacterium]|nr:DAK2 domain-containing protein [Erysipelotrichaceae bacterium]
MKELDGALFKSLLASGMNNLTNNHKEIDALNVFPVPDGDTGTNMNMTFTSGVQDALKVKSEYVGDIAKALSKGLLMGARGNSGVILSQIFRGFYQSVEGKASLTALDLAGAFLRGSEVAYKAVMRPVEGTILTVIRESSFYAHNFVLQNEQASIEEYMDVLVKEAFESLQRTPDLLPVLKEVGVVDSGGAGLLTVLQGFQKALLGNPVQAEEVKEVTSTAQESVESEEFGYCTEFILKLNEYSIGTDVEDKLKRKLSKIGESLVVVQDEDIVKVHVHTLTPGEALNLGQRYGEFIKLKIENMTYQHEQLIVEKDEEKPHKKYALITVATGEGLTEMFRELRVDVVISGGQTMNPSTEDFVSAIKGLNADHVIILPNNSNIILAAQQAQSVFEDDVDVIVVPTKSIPQGLSACIMFNPEGEVEDNIAEMNAAAGNVCTGQVTYAIKDTTFDGLEIHEGDYMGIKEKTIVSSVQDKMETTRNLVDSMLKDSEYEIVTLIAGEDTTEEELQQMESYITDTYDLEVESHIGGQAVYSFIIGAE